MSRTIITLIMSLTIFLIVLQGCSKHKKQNDATKLSQQLNNR